MKNYSIYFITLLLISLSGCNNSSPQNGNPEYIVYKGATLFDGTGKEIDNSIIIIKDGRIESVGDDNTPIPDDSEIIDVEGKYITPGLIDAHVHLGSTGFFDTRPSMVDLREYYPYLEVKAYQRNHPERYFETYLRSGVTGVYDVGGPPWTIQLQQSAEKDLNAPHIAAAGTLIGDFPENLLFTMNPPVEKELFHLASDSVGRRMVEYNSYLGSTGIKVLGMYPDNEEYMNKIKVLAEEASKRGNKLIVHAQNLQASKAALKMGAKMLVHGVRDQIVDSEFIDLLRKHGAIYTTTMLTQQSAILSRNSLLGEKIDLEDPNEVVDSKTSEMIESADSFKTLLDTVELETSIEQLKASIHEMDRIQAVNLKKVFEAGISIAVGTDAGIPGMFHGISIHNELEKMQEAGIPPADLIIMATRNGAMAMERFDDIGTLEKGKMADLIILEKDPSEDISNMRSITHVMRGGFLRSVDEPFK